jgi:3-hydroxyisobutyrate dehydrogenase
MNVGVLGTGVMGAPMARRLAQAGFDVRVWNRTAAAAEAVGAEVAESPAAVVAGADVVITMLSDGPIVDEVMRSALPEMPDEAVWLQMSTVGVDWSKRLVAAAAARGVAYVDAPVMGSRPQAEDGSLMPLVSGPAEARDRVTPLLEALSRRIMWLGDEPGVASALKLVANQWTLVATELLAETLALAEGLELDPRLFFDLISGASFDMEYAHWKGDKMLSQNFEAAFTLRLGRKDLALAVQAAEGAGLDPALAEVTHARFGLAIELGHGDEDSSATYMAARRRIPLGERLATTQLE